MTGNARHDTPLRGDSGDAAVTRVILYMSFFSRFSDVRCRLSDVRCHMLHVVCQMSRQRESRSAAAATVADESISRRLHAQKIVSTLPRHDCDQIRHDSKARAQRPDSLGQAPEAQVAVAVTSAFRVHDAGHVVGAGDCLTGGVAQSFFT